MRPDHAASPLTSARRLQYPDGEVSPRVASQRVVRIHIKEISMNKDQVKGAAKDVAGKAQEKAGELTGSEKQQLKGLKKQGEGKIQQGVGDVKDAFDEANDKSKP
jgi:uncharacterized protein YjbJ (UPF0337 family)